MTAWRIVCDVGGTNVRLARSEGVAQLRGLIVRPTAALVALEDEISAYARQWDDPEDLEGAAIAAAGPVEDGTVELTNANLEISAHKICDALGKPVRLVNDLAAVAWALPHLARADLIAVCAVDLPLAGPRLVINIGTGFGAAVLMETRGGLHVLSCEPGHMKLASGLENCSAGVGVTASIEDVFSGRALMDRERLREVWRLEGDVTADVFGGGANTNHRRRFLSDFSALLGQVCGDLVLATGAWGGVYLCGSVLSGWVGVANREAFQSRFRDKGPMSARMKRVGVNHIAASHPSLLGLAAVPL